MNMLGKAGTVMAITLSCTCLHGAVVNILSGTDPTGTSQWNSAHGLGVANVGITPSPVWAVPPGGMEWVSFTDSGQGATVLPDAGTFGALAASPTASFFVSFNLPNPINTGGITVWADDTAEVFLYDQPAAPQLLYGINSGPTDSHCATGPISCGQLEGGLVNLSGLSAGAHTLRIDTWQLGTGPFGLMYGGSINSDPVPEPGTASYILLFIAGAGLYLGAKSGRLSAVRR
jgi:hypothetical protein